MKELLDRKAELQKDLDSLINAMVATIEAIKKVDELIKMN